MLIWESNICKLVQPLLMILVRNSFMVHPCMMTPMWMINMHLWEVGMTTPLIDDIYEGTVSIEVGLGWIMFNTMHSR